MSTTQPKMATLGIFDRVKDIKISDSVKYDCEYTIELYKEYLIALKYLQDKEEMPTREREAYLKQMKEADIKVNQTTERENEYLIEIYRMLSKDSVLDKLIRKNGKNITTKELKKYHHLLLKGTSCDEGETEYIRKNNDAFVGNYNIDGSKNIHYMPVDYKDIPQALKLLRDYYNGNGITKEEEILIRPFLLHAIVACLQMFTDGNTRLARVLQHAKIWTYTNDHNYLLLAEEDRLNLSMPALYLTGPYYASRGQYREIIKDLVVIDSDKAWNKWLEFNLYKTQEALFKQTNDLNTLKREIKRYRR